MSVDAKLIKDLVDEYLENWEQGKDVAWGRGLGFEMCFGEGPKHVAVTYPEFNRVAFEQFIKRVEGVEVSPFHTSMVNYFSVGINKNGFQLSAEIISF